MVMIFQSDKALKELFDSGIVYTFRLLRSDGQTRKLGKEWFTYKRGGKKLGDIIVSTLFKLTYPTPLELKVFAPYSGFKSVDDWIKEIKHLNKPDPDDGYSGEIYCIHLIGFNGDLVSKYINGEL